LTDPHGADGECPDRDIEQGRRWIALGITHVPII
jgi:hypothetical protein